MTLAEIESCGKEVLTVAQIAPLVATDQQTLRLRARSRPDLIPFPVIVIKSRVKIPRRPFLNYMKYGDPSVSQGDV